jgi:transposase
MMGWTAPDGIKSATLVILIRSSEREPSMKQVSMIGLDLAKNVFAVHGIDAAGNVVIRRSFRRAQMEKFFAQLSPTIVGMEACGSAHHWGRLLGGMGHEIRIMPAAYVTPYVKRNKNDGRDAEAVCEAAGRPTMRFVPVKSLESQAMLAMHRARTLLVRQRTMLGNSLRAIIAEFGVVAPKGIKGLYELMAQLAQPNSAIPELARASLLELKKHCEALDGSIRKMEAQIVSSAKADATVRRIMAIPGLGPIGGSAIVAKVPDARVFKRARDLAAWIGLTPQQFGTGGKQRSGGISKQGDRSLRALLITGACAHLRQEMRRGVTDPWLRRLLAERPFKVVAVAYAAKMARIIWAMLVSGEPYRSRTQTSQAAARQAAAPLAA